MPKDTLRMLINVPRHCPIHSLGRRNTGCQTCIPCEPICGMLVTVTIPWSLGPTHSHILLFCGFLRTSCVRLLPVVFLLFIFPVSMSWWCWSGRRFRFSAPRPPTIQLWGRWEGFDSIVYCRGSPDRDRGSHRGRWDRIRIILFCLIIDPLIAEATWKKYTCM